MIWLRGCMRSRPFWQVTRTILFISGAVVVLLSSACDGMAKQPPQKTSPPSNPEAAVMYFLRSLESGEYEGAANVLVDANGRPLDDLSRSALIQAWRAAWGPHPEIHIVQIRFVDRIALGNGDLAKLHASQGYKVTFNTFGRSATPCFKVPVAHASMVVISIGAAWRPVEEFQSQYVPSLCVEQAQRLSRPKSSSSPRTAGRRTPRADGPDIGESG